MQQNGLKCSQTNPLISLLAGIVALAPSTFAKSWQAACLYWRLDSPSLGAANDPSVSLIYVNPTSANISYVEKDGAQYISNCK